MRVLFAPDSFKESLDSPAVASALAAGWADGDPSAEVVLVPMADGGEGTVDAVVTATGGTHVTVEVPGPLGAPVRAPYGRLPDGTAVIETAAATGLALVPPEQRHAARASSYGTGCLIAHALDAGARTIVLGLGGSASTDGGSGVCRALGVRLLDAQGDPVEPGGQGLADLARIDLTEAHPGLAEADLVAACDVDNPLTGPRGAAAVFGPQKGADPTAVGRLDSALGRLARVTREVIPSADPDLPGSGAAGGIGFAVVAILGGRLAPGVEIVADAVGLDDQVRGADLVVTGEGRLDGQSLAGKTPVGVLRVAQRHSVPTIAVAGQLGDGVDQVTDAGVTAVFATAPGPVSLERALEDAPQDLRRLGRQLGAMWAAARHA